MEFEAKFEEWAVIDLFGHRRLAGKVREAAILGGQLLRLDIPLEDGNFLTQFLGPSAIYSMTVVSEEVARHIASLNKPEPIHQWEFPQLPEAHSPDGLDKLFPYEDDD
jgi:hypothetical protein